MTTVTVKVQNTAPENRLVTIHGNSGKTWHLPPMYTAEIPENEIIGNQMVERLEKNKCLCRPEKIQPSQKKTTKSTKASKSKSSRSGKPKSSAHVKSGSTKAKKQ